jgi:hypothetical protein
MVNKGKIFEFARTEGRSLNVDLSRLADWLALLMKTPGSSAARGLS